MRLKKLSKLNVIFLKKLLLNLFIFVLLWLLFYKILRKILIIDYVYEQGIYYLTKIQLIFSKLFLQILGYSVEIFGKTVKIDGSFGVHLDRGCLGRNTMGMFAGFILIFPGRLRDKLWFIFLGIVIFLFLNTLRITALAITDYCCVQYLDFNHHFVFKIIVYFAIFLLWTRWIKRYSFLKNEKK